MFNGLKALIRYETIVFLLSDIGVINSSVGIEADGQIKLPKNSLK